MREQGQREELEAAAEAEVARLEEQLASVKARSDALVQKHEAELQQLLLEDEKRKRTDKNMALKAKDAAAAAWKAKMQAIEAHYQRKLLAVNDEAATLREHLYDATTKLASGTHDRMEAGQVRAEFDGYKAMTRRLISQKDEELERLERLRQMEEGEHQAEREAAMLEAVARRMEGSRQFSLHLPAALQGDKLVVMVMGTVAFILLTMVYNAYRSTDSLLCLLDSIGLKIGKGCV